ncbi:hypothetical protein Tco_1361371, partial [Tanacetum coccineum]
EGVSLLQNGLRIIASGLSAWQQNQLDYSHLHGEFLTRFSNLEDAVGQMAATISQTKSSNVAALSRADEVSEMTEEYSEDNLVSKINYNCLYNTGRSTPNQVFPFHYKACEVEQLNQVCGSRDAFLFLTLPQKVSENNLEVLKVLDKNLEAFKVQENPVDRVVLPSIKKPHPYSYFIGC